MYKFLLILPLLSAGHLAFAAGIPADATVFRQLRCTAQLDGPYQGAKTAIIQDVTYLTPPATFENYNSRLDLTLSDGSVLEGVMNESNGNDPQEYRDSGTEEDSGMGGMGMYAVAAPQPDGSALVLMTRTQTPFGQRNLAHRVYQFSIIKETSTTQQTVSTGQLDCELQN
jgi:hypothetical protein